ncbi:MAG TPA: zinc-ribbon domain-containing protein, partial [Blastocatellia bacterium]|nr:zinc-ribbon domain-containing protein [Blastocatellia bacterium]
MFCPSCGSNNVEDVKFCTRCGTNLDVVSNALRGRTTGALETDERTVTLLKDYYRSRRMLFIGAAASIISLFKLALLLVLGFPDKLMPLTVLLFGLLLFGLFALIWGITKWNNSSSEMKALGVSPTKRRGVADPRSQLRLQSRHSSAAVVSNTDPIAAPASVTER